MRFESSPSIQHLMPCRLIVRQRTLTPLIEVQILAGHPVFTSVFGCRLTVGHMVLVHTMEVRFFPADLTRD